MYNTRFISSTASRIINYWKSETEQTCGQVGRMMALALLVKTLNLTVEYTFQLEAYI